MDEEYYSFIEESTMDPLDEERIKNLKKKGMRDSSFDPPFCGCFSYRCWVNFTGIIATVDLIYKMYQATLISQNEYFDDYYMYGYLILLTPLIAGFIYFMTYFTIDT